jgi:hypothetical protein
MDNLKETLTELKNMLSDAMITQIDLDLKIKLVCKLNEALRIHDVVGRGEQLLVFLEWYDSNVCQNDCRSREDLVKDFMSQ